MTDPASIPPRLSPAEARERLLAIIQGPDVARSARSFTKKLVHLDQWPPADPRELAIECLDEDTAPDADDVKASAMIQMAEIMIALVAHRAFEEGRRSVLDAGTIDVTEVTTGRARALLSVVGACMRVGTGLSEDAVLPSLEDALRPFVEREAHLASTIMQLRDVLYPGGSGALAHGGEEAGMVNNILRTMGFGPTDGRDGPDDVIEDEDTHEDT